MKTIALLLCLVIYSKAESIPTLRFEKEITWKQIFDFGFRPKYFDADVRSTCVCMDQVFWLQFKDHEPKLKLDKGRIRFNMPISDEIHMLWHQGEMR